MSQPATASILEHFSSIEDHRMNRQKLHKLHKLEGIFFITLCAVISSTDNWVAIEEFGNSKIDWFTQLFGIRKWNSLA